MIRKIYIVLILSVLSAKVIAQDNRMYNKLSQSACFYTINKEHKNDTTDCSNADISFDYCNGETDGDFLVYQGKSRYQSRINGGGVKDYGKFGILTGKCYYANGKDRGISWNAMRFPELYLPYIITDSTGGDSKYETYYAQGGYAKKIGSWHFGFDFSFLGEQAYRLTDPRVLNNTTFLTFKLSSGKVFNNGNALWLSAYYMRNKQYLHDRYWRPGEQQRFFVIYGFGLYDTKESVVAFGVSRMYYINNAGAELSFLSPDNKRVTIAATLNYDYKKMYTEESDIMQLYNTRNHSIRPSLAVSYHSGGFNIKLYSNSEILRRKGYENILEKYVTDEANSTYDFRKIADEQNYNYTNILSDNTLRLVICLGKNEIGFESGAAVLCRKEKNTKYAYLVKNVNVAPEVKTDFSLKSNNQKHNLNIGFGYSRQISLKHNYEVEIKNNAIPHVDFQTCFAPYAYYSAEYDCHKAQLCYAYSFEKFSMGIKFDGYIINGKRLDDVAYTKTIGYNSVCPMISPYPDKHNEKYLNSSIFVKF